MNREITKEEFISIKKANKFETNWKHKIQAHFFEFFLYIMNSQNPNHIIDSLCVLIELCQFLTFPLSPRYAPIWKNDSIYLSLSQYLQYFLFIPLFKGSADFYIIIFYLMFICIISICGLFIYSSICITKNQNLTQVWILHILSFTLSLFGNVIYLPLLESMLSIFYCEKDNTNKYSNTAICWNFVHILFALIGIILLVSNTLFYLYICFDIRKKNLSNNSKKTSIGDIGLIIIKTYLSSVNAFFDGENFNLVIIFISFSASAYLMYLYWIIRPYYSTLLTKLYYMSTFVLCWGYALVFIGALFINSSFNGGLPLLFIGIAVIAIIIAIPGEKYDSSLLFLKCENIHNGELFKNKLVELEALCDSEENGRQNGILVRSYVQKYEETCSLSNCFLKQYLRTSERILLYYHIESLYQIGISMYPYCASIRLMYVILLIDKLNKIRKAKGELEKISMLDDIELNDLFALYHLNKTIEIRLLEGNSLHSDHTSDLAFIRYKSLSCAFKILITKAASLYLEFWNLLLISRNEIQEDLTKLNDIGSRINTLVEEITLKIDTLQKIKKNDEDIIQLYSEFLCEILNKKELAQEYKKQLCKNNNEDNDIEENNKFDEGELVEDDFISLTTKKDRMFIVISAQNESMCNITHISLGISSRLGYLREELIGQSLDILLPEIYRKYHRLSLMNKINDNRQRIVIEEEERTSSKFKTIDTFILTKSKYIFPITFNIILLQNENGKSFFIAKILNLLNSLQYDDNNTIPIEDTCYVLTNKFLRIKNFTSNAIRLLGLSSLEMNGAFDLTSYIKEFNEEYLKSILINTAKNTNKREDTNNSNLLIQNTLEEANLNATRIDYARTFFKNSVKIIWKPHLPVNNYSANQMSTPSFNLLINRNHKIIDPTIDSISSIKRPEVIFYVSIIEQKIGSHQIGFAFKFETINPNTIKHKTNSSFHNNQRSSKSVIPNIVSNAGRAQLGFLSEKKSLVPESYPTLEKPLVDSPVNFLMQRNKSVLENLKHRPNNSFQAINQNSMTFDKSFLPEISSKFIIDPSKNAFIEMKTNDAGNQLRIALRQKAVDCIELAKIITTETTSSIEENSNNITDSSHSSDIKQSENSITIHMSIKEKTLQTVYWENYYHINYANNIKLQIYDFKHKIPVDILKTEYDYYQSEVEKKLSQIQSQLESSVDIDSSSMIQSKNVKNKKTNMNNTKKIKSSSSLNFLFQTNTQSIQAKEFMIRQIDLALKKKETQITIILFQLISFLSLAVIVIEAGIFIQLALSNQLIVKNTMSLVVATGELIILSVHCNYHVREITLLTDNNYTFLYQEKQDYIMNHTLTLFFKFNEFTAIQKVISASPLCLSNEKYIHLYNKTVSLQIIDEEFNENSISVSIYSSFILLQLSLFRLTQTPFDLLIPSNKEAYFYISNSNNRNIINQREQIQIFYEMINKTSMSHKNSMIIFIILVFALHLFCYFLMRYFYNNVAKKKDSYLKVFLDINQLVIARSYEKCDKFLNKLQLGNNNHNDKLINGDNASSVFQDEDMPMTEKMFTNELKGTKPQKKIARLSKESKILNILFFLIFFFAFALLLAIVLYYWQFLDRIITLTHLLEIQLSIQIMTMMSFNIIREFIFDINSKVYLQPIKEYTERLLSNYTYEIKQLQESFEEEMSSLSPQFQMAYYQLHSQNICYFATDFFDTYFPGYDCDTFTNNVPAYGLKVTLSFFFEELREMKTIGDLYSLKMKNNNFQYNFTYINTPIANSFWPTDPALNQLYFNSLPIHIFNSEDYLILAFLFRFIIQPAFRLLMKNCYFAIAYEAEGTERIITIGAIIYLCFFIIFYIVIWKPFELRLNNTIYKSKNMLTIIPKEVLVSINNIHILLDIEKNDLINELND